MTQAATPASAISRPKTQGDRDNNGRFLPGHRVGANTRYRPGHSGNPQGRPPEVRYVSEYMHDLLPFPVERLEEVAEDPAAPTAARIAAGLLLDAVSGEGGHVRARARDQVMNRIEGRPAQALQISGPEEIVVNQIVGPDGPAEIVWADKSRLLEAQATGEEAPAKLLPQDTRRWGK